MAVTPAQSNVAPGDSVFLRCSHTSTDRGASYAWERLDGMDMMTTGRFEASGRSGEVLRITFAEEADSGVYVCRVTSSQGVQTGTAQVFVGEYWLSSFLPCAEKATILIYYKVFNIGFFWGGGGLFLYKRSLGIRLTFPHSVPFKIQLPHNIVYKSHTHLDARTCTAQTSPTGYIFLRQNFVLECSS